MAPVVRMQNPLGGVKARLGGGSRPWRQHWALAAAAVQLVLALVLFLRVDNSTQLLESSQPPPSASTTMHTTRTVLRYVKAPRRAQHAQSPPQPATAPPQGHADLEQLPPGLFNPSIALHNNEAWAVVRSQYVVRKRDGKRASPVTWGLNSNHLAHFNLTDLSIIR